MNKTSIYIKILLLASLLAVALIVPVFVTNPYFLRILVMIFIYSILAVSLNFIAGVTGLLSLGHIAFCGIGAYVTGILMTRYGFNFVSVLLLAGIFTFVAGFLVGLPLLRVRGDYLCMVTIAFGEVFRSTMQALSFTGGPTGIIGIPVPTILGFRIASIENFYYLSLILLSFTLITLMYILHSKFGRAQVAIREDELAAECLGINTKFYKIISFSLGAAFAGIGGCVYAVFLSTISPSNFTLAESVLLIIMVIVGGLGNLLGSVLGAALMLLATEAFRPLYEYRLLMIGLIVVGVLLYRPQGIFGIIPRGTK